MDEAFIVTTRESMRWLECVEHDRAIVRLGPSALSETWHMPEVQQGLPLLIAEAESRATQTASSLAQGDNQHEEAVVILR